MNIEEMEPAEIPPNDQQKATEINTNDHKENSDPKPEEIEVVCKCGANMKLIQPSQCSINIGLRCNNLKCKKEMKQNEWFYHCIENSSNTEFHKGPYNYCYKCAQLKMKLIAKRNAKAKKKQKAKEKETKQSQSQSQIDNEWTPTDIYDIFNKVKEKLNINDNNDKPMSLEEKYDLNESQVKLLYLIPDDMHKHVAIWIKSTNADSTLMHEYNEMCQELFHDIDMNKFPHFAVFGCDTIQFEQLPLFEKYSMQRILIILATHHVSLTYCPQIVHLIGKLLSKMDEKCVFALTHSMLKISRKNNLYFTFTFLQNSIRIQTLLSLIKSNVKMVASHLEKNNTDNTAS